MARPCMRGRSESSVASPWRGSGTARRSRRWKKDWPRGAPAGAIEEQALLGLELAQALAEDGDLAKAREQLETAEATTPLDPALNLMARALYTRGVIHVWAQE